MTVKHPAKFSDAILERLADLLATRGDEHRDPPLVLDPFAGTGKVHQLDGIRSVGVEIEPEWATMHPNTVVGNTLHLPFRTGAFAGMITSPCLAQEHRVLTNDLSWVPVGDVEVGDELLAFDEHCSPRVAEKASRRRWRRATVVRSEPKRVECVRVILETGEEIVTTPEHPWLANRYSHRTLSSEWAASSRLMGTTVRRGPGAGRNWQRGGRQPYFVCRQMDVWSQRTSFDAGWLAGMFDGEGSLAFGVHGCPKLSMCQVQGAVIDRAEMLMNKFGYAPNRITRTDDVVGRQKVDNLYVTGGFPAMLRALGELRPTRLLDKWEHLDLTSRTVQAKKVRVMAVEPAGLHDIQEIETSEGTYFAEGYMMHNCYGNRLADHHRARDSSYRNSYTHTLGRTLHNDNSGTLHWGEPYREFHDRAWTECLRVLQPGAFVMLNVSNHVRKKTVQPVVEWHLSWFLTHQCTFVELEHIETPRLRAGANSDARVPHEFILHLTYRPKESA